MIVETVSMQQPLNGTTEHEEITRLLERIAVASEKILTRQDEAFKDMHHELREMKVALYKLSK